MATLQERLANYLIARPFERVAKGFLEVQAREKMGVTAETVGRRMRVLHEVGSVLPITRPTSEHKTAKELLKGGKIEVEYRGRNHAFYYYVPPVYTQKREFKMGDDGRMKEIITTNSSVVQ